MAEHGRSAADAASGYSAEPESISVVSAVPVSIPNAADYPDDRPIFEARPVLGRSWIWEVWDIEHPAKCNDFPVIRVDSRGAADDFHADYARLCADALNAKYAASANRFRREEASAIDARQRRNRETGSGPEGESAVAKPDAQ